MKYIKTKEDVDIKYLKKYNDFTIKTKYWKIIGKKYLKFAMKKIGISPEEIERLYGIFYCAKDPFFILKEYNKDYKQNHQGEYLWGWNNEDPTDPKFKQIWHKDEFEYMGEIDIQEYEVDAEKYNL